MTATPGPAKGREDGNPDSERQEADISGENGGDTNTPRKEKALRALLTAPTKKAAAEAAGISDRTLREYLQQEDFQEAYKDALSDLVRRCHPESKSRSCARSGRPARYRKRYRGRRHKPHCCKPWHSGIRLAADRDNRRD